MTNEERSALIAQGWTPPVAVDPDIAEAKRIAENWDEINELVYAGIKRGRALAAAETKPKGPQTAAFQAGSAGYRDWHDITHHAIITQPEEK